MITLAGLLVGILGFLWQYLTYKNIMPVFPCLFHDLLRLYCPGCGGTRSVKAFLRFQIINSLFSNPFVFYTLIFGLYYYIGGWVTVIKNNGKRYYRYSDTVLYIAVALLLGNFIIRNILLVCYKIDYLGDFYPVT